MIYIVHDTDGRPIKWSTQIDEVADVSGTMLEYDGEIPTSLFYVDGQTLVEIGRPQMNKRFDYSIKQWVDARTEEEQFEATEREVRQARATLLAASDWTQVPDAPVDQAAWQVYRQALRDITEQEGFPLDITWPVPPS